MIYVYRNSSMSATGLFKAIEDLDAPVTRLKAMSLAQPGPRDLVVNWGAYVTRWPWTTRVLNRHIIGDKFRELAILNKARVPVPHFRTDKPRPDHGRWIARRFEHEDGQDLLAGLTIGDYYTQWHDLDAEFRFHIFKGKCIKKQYKEQEGNNPSWIRCSATGWDWINGGEGSEAMKQASVEAIAALGYDFGAVDVGRCRAGGFLVLEVNSGPGIDPGGNTVYQYAKAVIEESKKA